MPINLAGQPNIPCCIALVSSILRKLSLEHSIISIQTGIPLAICNPVSGRVPQNTTTEETTHRSSSWGRTSIFLSYEPHPEGNAEKKKLRSRASHTAPNSPYHEWVVEVSNLVEKVDLIFARKQCGANTVHRCVAPTLLKEKRYSRSTESPGPGAPPHNRIHPSRPKILQISCRLHPSRSRGHRSQSYSRLTHGIGQPRGSQGEKKKHPHSGNGCKSLHRHQR